MSKKTLLSIALVIILTHCSDDTIETSNFHYVVVPQCSEMIFPFEGCYVPDNKITFSWNKSVGASTYDLYLSQNKQGAVRIAAGIKENTFEYSLPTGEDINYEWFVQPLSELRDSIDCSENRIHFTTKKDIPGFDTERIVVRVMVLNYDPILVTESNQRVHEYFGWLDSRFLSEQYIHDVLTSSDSLVKYEIVEWQDINEFPVKSDSYQYTVDEYIACIRDHSKCHLADGVDYLKALKERGALDAINNDQVDEVWLFGGPYFGYYESAMAGPNSFYINGGVFPSIKTDKAFVIMGFNYERGPAEMMHDLCHRTEGTMAYVYGQWNADQLNNNWSRFAANSKQSKGIAAVGSCHFPPNAGFEYDYASYQSVSSFADDWLNYPILSGKRSSVNASRWNGPDYQRNYLNWWFSYLPRRQGTGADGKLNCWWRYVFQFNETILN